MNNAIVARQSYPVLEQPDPDALSSAIAQQRGVVLALEALVAGARDACARTSAELDAAVRQRNAAIFELAALGELSEDAAGR